MKEMTREVIFREMDYQMEQMEVKSYEAKLSVARGAMELIALKQPEVYQHTNSGELHKVINDWVDYSIF